MIYQDFPILMSCNNNLINKHQLGWLHKKLFKYQGSWSTSNHPYLLPSPTSNSSLEPGARKPWIYLQVLYVATDFNMQWSRIHSHKLSCSNLNANFIKRSFSSSLSWIIWYFNLIFQSSKKFYLPEIKLENRRTLHGEACSQNKLSWSS